MFQLIGVNGIGYENSNDQAVAGRTLPWLQDVASQNVWVSWGVEYRDVIIVDAEGNRRDVYNLTTHDLAVAANRETLKRKLEAAR